MRAGRMQMNCEFEHVIWPPLRLARMRCQRGSVFVVLPAGSLFVTNDGGNIVRIIGMDIHRVAAEVVSLLDGEIVKLGRVHCATGLRSSPGGNSPTMIMW